MTNVRWLLAGLCEPGACQSRHAACDVLGPSIVDRNHCALCRRVCEATQNARGKFRMVHWNNRPRLSASSKCGVSRSVCHPKSDFRTQYSWRRFAPLIIGNARASCRRIARWSRLPFCRLPGRRNRKRLDQSRTALFKYFSCRVATLIEATAATQRRLSSRLQDLFER